MSKETLDEFIRRLRPRTRKKLKGRIKAARKLQKKTGLPYQIKIEGKTKA